MTYNFEKAAKFLPVKTASTVVLAITFSTNTLLPVFAGTTTQKTLISQQSKKVEITLVTYAVTKAAYSKIIP